MKKGVGIEPIYNFRQYLGSGYVIIPEDYKGRGRDTYIKYCYRTQRVSIIIEDGGVKLDCFVTESALRDIVFPDFSVNEKNVNGSRLGSQVVFLNEPRYDKSVVLGVVSKRDETNLYDEQEFRIFKTKYGNFALISVNGKSGDINITTFNGDKEGGDVNISISNQSDSAKLNVGVRGEININTTGNVNLIAAGEVNIKPSKLNIGKEKLEPIIKGDKAETELNKEKKVLTDFLDAVKNLTPTPVPPNAVDPTWATLKTAIAVITDRADYSQIKSDKTFSE